MFGKLFIDLKVQICSKEKCKNQVRGCIYTKRVITRKLVSGSANIKVAITER